jgi:serine/threonine-protein kinase
MEMQSLLGQTLGNWRISRLLGEGAFGAVFEAEHCAISGRKGAIKVLKPELSMQSGIKQRFLNEASAASRAEHENIVQIFDGGIAPDGTCYQVMEMLNGTVLTKLIQREKRLDAARTVNIAVQIASALQAAHNLQIVHRDLKPDNVFIVERTTNPEFVKVLDFGVAKLRGDPLQTDEKLTSTGMIIGTAPYMAPEQWQARPDIDGRADVYALGVIMFEMLCGQRPYSAATAYEWIMLHMEATPPDPVQFGVQPQLARVIRRMLSRQPELRPRSMRDVIQDLRTACRGIRGIAAFSGDAQVPLSSEVATVATGGQPAYTPPPQTPQPYTPPSAPTAVAGSPGYGQQPGYGAPQTGYGQPGYPHQSQAYPNQAYPNQAYPSQAMAYPQPGQPMMAPPPEPGRGRVILRRIGEVALLVIALGLYALFNWQEIVTTVRTTLQSLKPPT